MEWKKYKWYIIGYVLYTSIVTAITIYDSDFWQYFIVLCISIPITLYIIIHLIKRYLKKDKHDNSELANNLSEDNNNKTNTDLIQSWTLLEFTQLHGKMQVGSFKNTDTGESFKSCIFTNSGGEKVYVSFYSKLGELTPLQIKEKKEKLKVGLLNTSKYVLFEEWDGWADVVL